MESQRVGHDWVTELDWTELIKKKSVGTETKEVARDEDIWDDFKK